MNPALPPALSAALEALLDGVSRKELAVRAQSLSAAYRAGGTSRGITGEADAIAYGMARMPATFAALAAVFAAMAEAMPDFVPASVLDVGAGPGTASWAALAAWPELESITMLDHNAPLRALARKLADRGVPAMMRAEILAGELTAQKPRADLVIASYVLAELSEDRAAIIARDLWDGADRALVLVEPGTPAGFARIRAARAALIEVGGTIAAPCTHDNQCPMTGRAGASRSDNKTDDWCHFSQRLPRSRDHMQMKGANVPFEDERYAYVAVMRQTVTRRAGGAPKSSAARILAPPLEAKPGITFKLCDGDGLRAQFVPARDKDMYRRARKLGWGDLF